MGSLIAILGWRDPGEPGAVERMARAAPHRGARLDTVRVGQATLGVTSDDVGTEDVHADPADGLAAAFSGHLDNAEHLRGELGLSESGPGVAPGPAAILTAAFRRWGEEAPVRFRGPFVAAVSDGLSLWCYRDHMGFRPLFYRSDARGVWAATEVKQVVAGAGIPYQPNLEALEGIFWGWSGRQPRCAIRGVERFPGGSLLHASDAECRARRFWHPERLFESGGALPFPELQERFDELFERAVSRCMKGADAVALSGGVDSPAVAAYAAPVHRARHGEQLAALSSVFPDLPSVDESRYIRAVAEEVGLALHTFRPRARPTENLESWIRLFDGPVEVVSLSESLEIQLEAKELGFRNLLSGEIAELLFDARPHLFTYLVGHGRWGAVREHVRVRRAAGRSARRLLKEGGVAFVPAWLRTANRRLRGTTRDLGLSWMEPRPMGRFLSDRRNAWRDLQLLAVSGKSTGLEPNDYVQAKSGVTGRRPFADVDLTEFFLSLPAEVRYPDPYQKSLLRRLLRGRVPDLILDRRDKTVFDAFALEGVDYEELRTWLTDPKGYRVPGVDYENLAERLRREDLEIKDFIWVKDLAAIHVFLGMFDGGASRAQPAGAAVS